MLSLKFDIDLLNVKVYALEELMTALFLASKFEERDPFTFRINRYRLSKPDLSHYRNFIELACPWHQQVRERLFDADFKVMSN